MPCLSDPLLLPVVYVPLSLQEVQQTPDHMNMNDGRADCGRAR